MILTKPNIITFFIFSSLALAYLEFFSVRLAPFYVCFIVFAVFSLGVNDKVRKVGLVHLFLTIVMLVFLAFSLVITGESSVFHAFVFFMALASWPLFLNTKSLSKLRVSDLDSMYIFFSVFMSVGLILQYLLFSFFDYEFGRIVNFLNRIAFSFWWQDFSFLSLFVFSSVPLAFYKSKTCGLFVLVLSLFASVITTGRTGIFSFFMFLVFWVVYEFLISFLRLKINAYFLVVPFLIASFPFLYFILTSWLGVRNVRFDDAGRFQGYINSLNSFFDTNVFFGRFFDVDNYRVTVDIIPHNLFLYFLVFGGIFFLSVFLIWLCNITLLAIKAGSRYFWSMFIVIVGTMFIPSFFSMYFFAILISVILVNNLKFCYGDK